jgi:CHAT domain-containing protein
MPTNFSIFSTKIWLACLPLFLVCSTNAQTALSQNIHLFSLNDQLKVELVRVESVVEENGVCKVVDAPASKQPSADQWEIPMADDELFYFRLTNLSDKLLYPILLGVEEDTLVNKLFPFRDQIEALAPGKRMETRGAIDSCSIYQGSSNEERTRYTKNEKFVWIASESHLATEIENITWKFNEGLTNARAAQQIAGAAMMSNLGAVYGESQNFAKPVELFDVAVFLAKRVHNKAIKMADEASRTGIPVSGSIEEAKEGLAAAHNNLGLANYARSHNEKALENYEIALKVLSEVHVKDKTTLNTTLRGEAATLNNLGQVYNALARFDLAVETFQKALILKRQLKDSRGEFLVLNNLGSAHNLPGKYPQALKYFEQALAIAKLRKDKVGEATVINNIASAYRATGRRVEAEQLAQKSELLNRESGNRAGQAYALNNLALLRFSQGQSRMNEAAALYRQASQIFREIGNRAAEAVALSNLMFAYSALDQPSVAIYYGKQSINLTQELRGEIASLDKETQKSFLESRLDSYRKLANVLISDGRLPEAQVVLDLVKDREYEQVTRSGKAETIPYSQTEIETIAKIENLVPLERERAELQRLLASTGELSAAQNGRLARIDQDIAEANTEFDRALTELAKTEESASKRVGEIEGEKVLQSLLTELSEKTNSGVVALYTVLGTEEQNDASGKPVKDKIRSKFGWVIMVTDSRYTAYPIDVANLDETVFQFKTALSSHKFDPQRLAEKIYNAIFRQKSKLKTTLEEDLQQYFKSHPDKTLMWSLDGVLRYIPMAALHDGNQYLVQKYRSTVFTGKSLAWLMDEHKNNWKALGLGVSDKRPNFDELPGVKTELYEIVRESEQSGGILNGTIKLNEEFKRETFFNVVGAGAYPVVHISSHYSFDSAKPENSFLLAGDGNLTFTEIDSRKNLFRKVDLLTLSACDTGVSGNGKEAEGFAYLAQSLGAKSVIASLWKVSDAGTPELMIRFYKLRAANPQMSKGEAFRQAQLEMMGIDPKAKPAEPKPAKAGAERGAKILGGGTELNLPLYNPDGKPKYAHPHYWAPFVLIGNWR